MTETIPVVKIFESIQGEGHLIGRPTVFVLTGGCDYKCHWCDARYAVLPQYENDWVQMTSQQIFTEVQTLTGGNASLITLSGGDPALHDGLEHLIELAHRTVGHRFAIETQGTHPKQWLNKVDHVIFSPPPPSAKQPVFDINVFDQCLRVVGNRHYSSRARTVIIKIVLFTDVDYEFARIVHEACPDYQMYLQIGNVDSPELYKMFADTYKYWSNKIRLDHWYDVTLLPQLHTLVWGDRGS